MMSTQNRRTRLRALVTFEAAARHCNFTHAANELGVTQAAVSKQIRLLEEMVGTQLFVRDHKGMLLTEPGCKLELAVGRGFSEIFATIEDIQHSYLHSSLTITTTVAMATLWLMPHLANFRAEYPDIDVKLVVSDALTNLAAERVDIGIRYGSGDWQGVNSTFLFGVCFFPVCSPGYLERHPIKSPRELLDVKLLHLDGLVVQDGTWDRWLKEHGVSDASPRAELSFNNYPLLVQAAVAGQGVILGWGGVINPLLESGALVRVLSEELISVNSFFMVTPKSRDVRRETQIFGEWLRNALSEAHASPPPSP